MLKKTFLLISIWASLSVYSMPANAYDLSASCDYNVKGQTVELIFAIAGEKQKSINCSLSNSTRISCPDGNGGNLKGDLSTIGGTCTVILRSMMKGNYH